MRSFTAFVLIALALSVAAAAQGASSLSLSIKVSGAKVLYGHDVTLSGRLSSGAAGRRIEVFSRPYGTISAHRIATLSTGVNGGWSLRVQPAILTSYHASTGSVATPPLTVAVRPALTERVRTNGSIFAHAAAAARSRAGRWSCSAPSGEDGRRSPRAR